MSCFEHQYRLVGQSRVNRQVIDKYECTSCKRSYSEPRTKHREAAPAQPRKSRTTFKPTHGMRGTPIYRVWVNMRCRPRRWDEDGVERWGVCEAWEYSFEAFYRDMGDRPSAAHVLRRRDVTAPYSAQNCYWDDQPLVPEQTNYERHLHYQGRTYTISELARLTKIPVSTLHARLTRQQLTVQEAVTRPVKRTGRPKQTGA